MVIVELNLATQLVCLLKTVVIYIITKIKFYFKKCQYDNQKILFVYLFLKPLH